MTSATAQARADVDDVSKRVECVGARDQPYRNFELRVGARAVFDDVEAFTIL